MVNVLRVNTDHGRDFRPLAEYMTKLRNVTKGEIHDVAAFPFSLLYFFNYCFAKH